MRNGIYLTTKSRKEGHGIGLQNVKLVVEKYHGQMEICHTEKSFQVKILLYMKLDGKIDKAMVSYYFFRPISSILPPQGAFYHL